MNPNPPRRMSALTALILGVCGLGMTGIVAGSGIVAYTLSIANNQASDIFALAEHTFQDDHGPPAGEPYRGEYYLVTSFGCETESSYGRSSLHAERPNSTTSPGLACP